MASDIAIAEALRDGEQPPTVRVYRWQKRVVTIGHLQDFQDARRTFPDDVLVRRPTGGKAVVHGDDLTISVTVPEFLLTGLGPKRGVMATYFAILEGLRKALEKGGLDTETGSLSGRQHDTNCFAAAASCDLRERQTGKKILGSAQMRKCGIVLQQMSLMPVQGIDVHSSSFVELLKTEMGRALGIAAWRDEMLSNAEQSRVSELLGGNDAGFLMEGVVDWPEKF